MGKEGSSAGKLTLAGDGDGKKELPRYTQSHTDTKTDMYRVDITTEKGQ